MGALHRSLQRIFGAGGLEDSIPSSRGESLTLTAVFTPEGERLDDGAARRVAGSRDLRPDT
jgi:hypothetical protein